MIKPTKRPDDSKLELDDLREVFGIPKGIDVFNQLVCA